MENYVVKTILGSLQTEELVYIVLCKHLYYTFIFTPTDGVPRWSVEIGLPNSTLGNLLYNVIYEKRWTSYYIYDSYNFYVIKVLVFVLSH